MMVIFLASLKLVFEIALFMCRTNTLEGLLSGYDPGCRCGMGRYFGQRLIRHICIDIFFFSMALQPLWALAAILVS
jgi:hypothetical protein